MYIYFVHLQCNLWVWYILNQLHVYNHYWTKIDNGRSGASIVWYFNGPLGTFNTLITEVTQCQSTEWLCTFFFFSFKSSVTVQSHFLEERTWSNNDNVIWKYLNWIPGVFYYFKYRKGLGKWREIQELEGTGKILNHCSTSASNQSNFSNGTQGFF